MFLGCLYDSKKGDQTLAIEPMHKKSPDISYQGFEFLTGDPYAIRTRECMRERHVS